MSTYSDLKGGIETTVYSTAADLPLTGVSGGAQAYVTETNRLYLWNGSGWYNIALINTAPTITTGAAATYTLAKDGTATVITLVATDPEGVPITWSHSVTTGTLGSTAVVTQSTNVFTVTPSSTAADAGTFSLTFTASDGINVATSTSAFTLSFVVTNSQYTILLATAVSTSDNNNITDASSSNHTITVAGDTHAGTFSPYSPGSSSDRAEYDTATHGGSVHFDGTGDWLVASSGSTDFGFGTGDFTIEFWINPNTVTNPAQSLLSMLTSASDTAPHIYLDTTIRFFESGSDRITGSTLAAGQWYHIALCKASSNTKLFVNGTQVGNTYSDSRNYGTNKPCVVGSYYSGGSVVTTSTVNSYISDLRVVKGTAVYTSNFTAPTAPLSSSGSSLHIKGTDASIIDKSQGSNLKLVGNTTGSTTQAKFSNTKSMLFPTSSGDYLQTTLSETIGTSQFTIECWVRRDTLGGPEGVFGIDTTALPAGTNGLAVYTGGTPYNWGFFINGTQTNTTTAPSAGTWYHLALVRDANNLVTMYIDGTSIDSDTYTDSIDGNVLTIGVYYTGTFGWNGNIQDFRITKGLARYTANFTPPTAPLIG
jgi:hypothetical protein